MRFLPLILRNLGRNKRRTVLTVLSIAVSLFIFATLMSLPGVVYEILRDQAGSLRLVCHGKAGVFYSLPEAYGRQIRTLPHVEAVLGENIFMGTYRGPSDQIPSAAVDAAQVQEMWPDFGISNQAAAEFRRLGTAALVGELLMKRFRWKVGDHVTLRGTIYPVDIELTIVGTLGGRAPAMALLFRRDYLEKALGQLGNVHLFWVKVDRSQSIPAVIGEIDWMFANSHAETQTESELGASQNSLANLRSLFDGIKVLAVIVMIAIALVASNTAAMSVRERRPEIAVLRAIGFQQRLVLSFLLAEGVTIGVVGGILGCGLAYVALKLIPYASSSLGNVVLMLRLPKRVVAESLVVAVVIGFASNLVPAVAATTRDITDTLRAA